MNDRITDAAEKPSELAKKFASDAYQAASESVQEKLAEKVQSSATYLENVASALHRAARELSKDAPLASTVAGFCADKAQDYAGQIEGKSASELVDVARDFARRQPVIVVGAAAALGFLAFRAFKNASPADEELDNEEYEGA
jgi:uncharacterized protein YigA (DUF484 family)